MGLKRGYQGSLFEGKQQNEKGKGINKKDAAKKKTRMFSQKGSMKKKENKGGLLKGKRKEKEEEDKQEENINFEERAVRGTKEKPL